MPSAQRGGGGLQGIAISSEGRGGAGHCHQLRGEGGLQADERGEGRGVGRGEVGGGSHHTCYSGGCVGTEGLHGSHHASSSWGGTYAMQAARGGRRPCKPQAMPIAAQGGRTWANQAGSSVGGTWGKGGAAGCSYPDWKQLGQGTGRPRRSTCHHLLLVYDIFNIALHLSRPLCSIRAACTSQLGQLEAKLVCIFAHMINNALRR